VINEKNNPVLAETPHYKEKQTILPNPISHDECGKKTPSKRAHDGRTKKKLIDIDGKERRSSESSMDEQPSAGSSSPSQNQESNSNSSSQSSTSGASTPKKKTSKDDSKIDMRKMVLEHKYKLTKAAVVGTQEKEKPKKDKEKEKTREKDRDKEKDKEKEKERRSETPKKHTTPAKSGSISEPSPAKIPRLNNDTTPSSPAPTVVPTAASPLKPITNPIPAPVTEVCAEEIVEMDIPIPKEPAPAVAPTSLTTSSSSLINVPPPPTPAPTPIPLSALHPPLPVVAAPPPPPPTQIVKVVLPASLTPLTRMSVVLPPLPPLPPSRATAPPPPPPPPNTKGSGTAIPIAATVSPLKPTYKTISLPSHKIIIAGTAGGNRVSVAKGAAKRPVDLLGSIMASMDKPAGSGSNSNSSSSTSSATTNSSLSSYTNSNSSF